VSLSVAKLVGVVLYLLALLAIGAAASRRMKDVRDYYAGGKNMGFWAVAFSARATGESAWLLLGLTGMGATLGLHAMWVVVGETLGVGAAWLWMARPFKELTDRYDSITMPDYLESRFDDRSRHLRIVSALALVVFVTVYVSAQIDATGTAFETFLGWNYYAGVFIGFAVVMVYITSGGFVAVVWSDVFQGALMGLGLVVLPVLGIVHAGGWDAVATGLRAIDPQMLSFSIGEGPRGWMPTLALACIGLGFLGSPQVFVRFIALRSKNEIGRGAAVALAWTVLADTGAVVTGMVGRHLLTSPGEDVDKVLGTGGEAVLPTLVGELLPPLLIGLFIAIVLSAIMSTVDSLLIVASSAVVRDGYQKIRRPDVADEALVGLSRKVTFALAAVALGIALAVAATVPGRTVFWFVIFGWSGIAATFCPTVILSLYWRGMTTRGALAAMVTGFACVPIFKFWAPSWPRVGASFDALEELPPAFVASLIAGVLVSMLDRRAAKPR
jgi:sodium/proline symporter